MVSISEELALFARDLQFSEIPEKVIEAAKLHILDALGIAFPSSALLTTKLATRTLHKLGGEMESTILIYGVKTSLPAATTANGLLMEATEFDDLSERALLHPTAAILPAVLGIGELMNSSGKELLSAYVAGVEVMIRLGAAARGKFHQRGIQPTSVCGVVAAALAASKLLGLEEKQFANTLGISVNFAFGSSLTVRVGPYATAVDPGRAAESGVLAAYLAREGLEALADTPIEGRFGLLETYAGPGNYDLNLVTKDLGTVWEIRNTFIKRYPLGYDFTRFIDAALTLREKIGSDVENIAEIAYGDTSDRIPVFSEPAAEKRIPKTMYDAKTSRYFVIAAAIVTGKITIETFTATTIRDHSRILHLAAKTKYVVDGKSQWVEVKMKDGRSFRSVQ
ncbi:MAG: MmgE/PrpD family protein, partial [Thaumarchaeota archaeon]|nr:MmgE/PrpD family protein [Nitrososphaerota archaeon]